MVSQMFKECLIEIYIGEQHGEAIFDTLLPKAQNDEQRFILSSLLQLETEGKARIRPILMKYDLSMVEHPDSKSYGKSAVEPLKDMSWTEQFAAMAKAIESVFLPKYQRLAKLVTEEEDAQAYELAKFMGDHEYALMVTSENIAVGRADSIAPVVELLQFPLIRPKNR